MTRSRLVPPLTRWRSSMPSALIDKADIVIGDWALLGSVQDVKAVFQTLQSIVAVDQDGQVVPLFNQPKISNTGLKVIVGISRGPSGNVTYPLRPVFGGELKDVFGSDRLGATLRHEKVRVALNCQLNLPHFLTAQDAGRSCLRGEHLEGIEFATAIQHSYMRYGSEHCLTDETNVLVGPRSLYN